MTYKYKTSGTCSQEITIVVENDTIQEVAFIGGCHGNLQGVSRLVAGMKVTEVIERLKGIKCGYKSTSCPDQLAIALEEILKGR
ncbi:MAG: TIGR03905 family TSCPD domain-containing protein [Marinilabiliaceae bacterium]|nr:TIGR03905 family TSCPD domain-containing protein [Marinilabiliaceae bacterium]